MVRVRRAGLRRARTPLPEDPSRSGESADRGAAAHGDELTGSGEARERILDAAEDLFAADGFDATPTSRIARRAAVAKGLLFYYFPRMTDTLRTLFTERLPAQPSSSVAGIAVKGDLAGSLVRLAEANFHRFDGPVPDLSATAEIVSSGPLA